MELKFNQQQQAQNLYYQTDLSNGEIASRVGVSTRTVSRWVNNEKWKSMKQAARHAPAAIVEKLYMQLNELNDHILSREPGQRFPSKEEADIMRKLTMTIDKLKQQAGLGEVIQLMMGFTNHVARHNLPLAQQITMEANSFIKGNKAELHKPFEMIYDTEDIYPDNEDNEDNENASDEIMMDNARQSLRQQNASVTVSGHPEQQPKDKLQKPASVTVSGHPERQPKDELRHGHDETMMDNARQSANQQQTTTQPLPVKDLNEKQTPLKTISLSQKNNQDNETMGANQKQKGLSKEERDYREMQEAVQAWDRYIRKVRR